MIHQINLILKGEVQADDLEQAEKIINKYVDDIADIHSDGFHYPDISWEWI